MTPEADKPKRKRKLVEGLSTPEIYAWTQFNASEISKIFPDIKDVIQRSDEVNTAFTKLLLLSLAMGAVLVVELGTVAIVGAETVGTAACMTDVGAFCVAFFALVAVYRKNVTFTSKVYDLRDELILLHFPFTYGEANNRSDLLSIYKKIHSGYLKSPSDQKFHDTKNDLEDLLPDDELITIAEYMKRKKK